MYLASHQKRATVADVASFFRISNPHVAKVVNLLARRGYIRSIRGIGGGIELGQPADVIRVGAVIREFEGKMDLLECVSSESNCVIHQHCKLRNVLAKAGQMQMDYLDQVRLIDVLPMQRNGVECLTDLVSRTEEK